MKKIVALPLIAALSLGVAACNKGSTENNAETSADLNSAANDAIADVNAATDNAADAGNMAMDNAAAADSNVANTTNAM